MVYSVTWFCISAALWGFDEICVPEENVPLKEINFVQKESHCLGTDKSMQPSNVIENAYQYQKMMRNNQNCYYLENLFTLTRLLLERIEEELFFPNSEFPRLAGKIRNLQENTCLDTYNGTGYVNSTVMPGLNDCTLENEETQFWIHTDQHELQWNGFPYNERPRTHPMFPSHSMTCLDYPGDRRFDNISEILSMQEEVALIDESKLAVFVKTNQSKYPVPIELPPPIPILYDCHGLKGNQYWAYLTTWQLYHPKSKKCLSAVNPTTLGMEDCNPHSVRQKWQAEWPRYPANYKHDTHFPDYLVQTDYDQFHDDRLKEVGVGFDRKLQAYKLYLQKTKQKEYWQIEKKRRHEEDVARKLEERNSERLIKMEYDRAFRRHEEAWKVSTPSALMDGVPRLRGMSVQYPERQRGENPDYNKPAEIKVGQDENTKKNSLFRRMQLDSKKRWKNSARSSYMKQHPFVWDILRKVK